MSFYVRIASCNVGQSDPYKLYEEKGEGGGSPFKLDVGVRTPTSDTI
jgi:hypothetical protein